MDLQAAQWVTIFGWPISALLALGVGILVGRFNRPKKRLIWSVMSEARLVDEQSMKDAPTPLRVTIGDSVVQNVALVRVRLGNGGNQEIIGAKAHIVFPDGALVHAARLGSAELNGAFSRTVAFTIAGSRVEVTFEHINPNRNVDVDLLVSGYPGGALTIEMAEPGVEVIRRESSWWARPITGVFGQFTAVSLDVAGVGVRYNPAAPALMEMADEMRRLRVAVARAVEAQVRDDRAGPASVGVREDWWTAERSVIGELVGGRYSKSKGKLVLHVSVRNVSPEPVTVTKIAANNTEIERVTAAVRFTMDPVEIPPGEHRVIEMEGIFENPVDGSLTGGQRATLAGTTVLTNRPTPAQGGMASLCTPSGVARLGGVISVNE